MGAILERPLKQAGQEASTVHRYWKSTRSTCLLKLQAGAEGSRFADWSQILFDQAMLAEGSQLDDPGRFCQTAERTDPVDELTRLCCILRKAGLENPAFALMATSS